MSYEEMRAREKTHVCAMCGGELVTIWDGEASVHRLCCGRDHTHNGFKQRLSPQKALQRGKADEVIGPGAQKELEERAASSWTALRLLPREDLGNRKELGIVEISALVSWAENLGLNAYLGHICLFYGKPYPTIDGYYYLNSRRQPPFHIGTRPMTDEEKIAFMIEDATHAFIAEAWLGEEKLPETGVGYVTRDEQEEKSERHPEQFRSPVVHGHPQRMAEKRAEWQLLRKLIPLEVKE